MSDKESDQKFDESHRDAWIIKPCKMYKQEYNECKAFTTRFHQYFVHGKTLDCSQWKTDYENCCAWTNEKSESAYEKLLESETKHRLDRLKPHYSNDVWKKRDSPPKNWNAQLPDWMQEEFHNSYLDIMNRRLKGENVLAEEVKQCTIL